jgi:predicted TIM-barrel fold metal-dependent hydrolase
MFNNGGTTSNIENFKRHTGGIEGFHENYRNDHLDLYTIEYGITTGLNYGINAAVDIGYAAAITSAINDFTIDNIATKEKRLKGSISIPTQDPQLAAKEIDRVGSHPEMVQVIVPNGAERPYGNSYYHPIYEACVRHNLPFAIHVSMEGIGRNPPPTGAGHVSHYAEYRLARAGVMMAHLASFIYEGVFELFPTLKVVMIEAGTLWIAPALWRMDQDWKALRHNTPWVKKWPTEYYRSNVRVTSQPIEVPTKPEMFETMLDSIYADECLMFSSDYPHWDFDSPMLAFPKMSDERWERIFYQNARELYNLPQRSFYESEAGGKADG